MEATEKNLIVFYHKPNCDTSRRALGLLRNKKIKPVIIEYLQNPPSEKELKHILLMLGLKAEQMVRKKEKLFKKKYEGKRYSESQWIRILVKNPILIDRPIVVKGNRAVLGRPPANVLKIL